MQLHQEIFFLKVQYGKKINANKRKTLNYIKENVPMRQLGNPEDISELCLYLSSNKSNFITGAIFTVDGGQTKKF